MSWLESLDPFYRLCGSAVFAAVLGIVSAALLRRAIQRGKK